jgi:hypothetical protein
MDDEGGRQKGQLRALRKGRQARRATGTLKHDDDPCDDEGLHNGGTRQTENKSSCDRPPSAYGLRSE